MTTHKMFCIACKGLVIIEENGETNDIRTGHSLPICDTYTKLLERNHIKELCEYVALCLDLPGPGNISYTEKTHD